MFKIELSKCFAPSMDGSAAHDSVQPTQRETTTMIKFAFFSCRYSSALRAETGAGLPEAYGLSGFYAETVIPAVTAAAVGDQHPDGTAVFAGV